MAKLLAIREVLSWLNMSFDKVIIESDCMAVINALVSSSLDLSEFGILLHDCFLLRYFPPCPSIRHDELLIGWLMNLPGRSYPMRMDKSIGLRLCNLRMLLL
ncbi:hypothetical protein Goarm_012355, partial [Gossypium armourianum]|nr:hypothetical protein [Gossypium armourianum]